MSEAGRLDGGGGGVRVVVDLRKTAEALSTTTSPAKTFRTMLEWIYTGNDELISPDNLYDLVAMAHCFGVAGIERAAERLLVLHLEQQPEAAVATLGDFAQVYQMARLRRRCKEVLTAWKRQKPK